MIQLEKFVGGGVVVGWLTPTTYIQLAGAGSKTDIVPFSVSVITFIYFVS